MCRRVRRRRLSLFLVFLVSWHYNLHISVKPPVPPMSYFGMLKSHCWQILHVLYLKMCASDFSPGGSMGPSGHDDGVASVPIPFRQYNRLKNGSMRIVSLDM